MPIEPVARVSPSASLVLHHGRTLHGAIVDWYAWLEDGLAGAEADAPASGALAELLGLDPD